MTPAHSCEQDQSPGADRGHERLMEERKRRGASPGWCYLQSGGVFALLFFFSRSEKSERILSSPTNKLN